MTTTDPPTHSQSLAVQLTMPLLPSHEGHHRSSDDDGHGYNDHCSEASSSSSSPSSSSTSPSLPSYVLRRARKNIRRTLALTFVAFASKAVWSQSPFSVFAALVWGGKRPGCVGYLTAMMGAGQVSSSLATKMFTAAAGRYSDSGCTTRDKDATFGTRGVLRCCAVVGVAAVASSLYATWWHASLEWLMVAMACWGVLWGVSDSVLPVVFGEAVGYAGTEQQSFERCSHLIRLGNLAGTLATLVAFALLGNEWTVRTCALVMSVGLVGSIPVLFLLCSLRGALWDAFPDDGGNPDDESCVVHEGEDSYDFECVTEGLPLFADEQEDGKDYTADAVLDMEQHPSLSPEASLGGSETGAILFYDHEDGSATPRCRNTITVPLMIFLADMLSSFAAGMSVRYFPVFLAQQLSLAPVSVQVLYLAVPFGQFLSPRLATALGRAHGPCRAVVALQWAFVVCMLSMVVSHRRGLPVWVSCVFFLMHGSLMNSTAGLAGEVVRRYDDDDSARCGGWRRWLLAGAGGGGCAAPQMMALWSVGAAVGGAVVGRWGLPANFALTAVLQLAASLPWTYLCCCCCCCFDDPGLLHGVRHNNPIPDHDGVASSSIASDREFDGDSGIAFQDCWIGEVPNKDCSASSSTPACDRYFDCCQDLAAAGGEEVEGSSTCETSQTSSLSVETITTTKSSADDHSPDSGLLRRFNV